MLDSTDWFLLDGRETDTVREMSTEGQKNIHRRESPVQRADHPVQINRFEKTQDT